jgi:hypothetical protein
MTHITAQNKVEGPPFPLKISRDYDKASHADRAKQREISYLLLWDSVVCSSEKTVCLYPVSGFYNLSPFPSCGFNYTGCTETIFTPRISNNSSFKKQFTRRFCAMMPLTERDLGSVKLHVTSLNKCHKTDVNNSLLKADTCDSSC